MMRYSGLGFNAVAFGFACLIMLCLLALLVLGIILVVRAVRKSGQVPYSGQAGTANSADPSKSTAMSILNERYAKGEISDEEYQKKKAQINS